MKTILALSILFFGSTSAMAGDLYNFEKAMKVMQNHAPTLESIPGMSSVGVTECVAGMPVDQYEGTLPDILPEACIQITFTSADSLKRAQKQYGKTFKIDGVTIFLGGVANYSPEPGLGVHN